MSTTEVFGLVVVVVVLTWPRPTRPAVHVHRDAEELAIFDQIDCALNCELPRKVDATLVLCVLSDALTCGLLCAAGRPVAARGQYH